MAAPYTAPSSLDSSFISLKRSLWQRIYLTITVHLVKAMVTGFMKVGSLPGVKDKAAQPTFTKVYTCQPKLVNRVFIPKSYNSGDVLPLYLSIHGGGFVFGAPMIDDQFCSNFANDNRVIVMSMDYPKAPEQPYPAAVNALTDTIKAVLEDELLPFDRKKVAIGGFSAGGNLSLAVTQDETLRSSFGGVVAYYPVVDFVTKGPEKIATRPEGAPPDMLENSSLAMFDYNYVPVGQDLRDTSLSVGFTQRENLPPKLCIIGCELDPLCREAEVFADKMASIGGGTRTGSDTLWEQNGVRWEKVLGEEHGFDARRTYRGEKRIRANNKKKLMYDNSAQWLFREVYN